MRLRVMAGMFDLARTAEEETTRKEKDFLKKFTHSHKIATYNGNS